MLTFALIPVELGLCDIYEFIVCFRLDLDFPELLPQPARISVTVSGGTSSISSVRLTNLSTADGNPGEIIAHDAGSGTYEALVAPQSVAVRMDGTVKACNVTPSTSDNTSATLTSTDPHYWTNHDNITVTAWWPYTAGETTPPAVKVAADQSARKDFEGSDFIVAEEQTVSYGNPTLRFTHRTARVTVVLTDYTEEQIFVRLTGLSTENGNPAVIAPYDKGGDTYTALVAPQSVATGTAFITCKFTNGKVFVYKMENDADWQAGKEYTYTVSLAAVAGPGYTVSADDR